MLNYFDSLIRPLIQMVGFEPLNAWLDASSVGQWNHKTVKSSDDVINHRRNSSIKQFYDDW